MPARSITIAATDPAWISAAAPNKTIFGIRPRSRVMAFLRQQSGEQEGECNGDRASYGKEDRAAQQRPPHGPGDRCDDGGKAEPAGNDTRARRIEHAGDDEAQHRRQRQRIGSHGWPSLIQSPATASTNAIATPARAGPARRMTAAVAKAMSAPATPQPVAQVGGFTNSKRVWLETATASVAMNVSANEP